MESVNDSINEAGKKILEELYQTEHIDFQKTSKLLSSFRIITREKTLTSELLDEKVTNKLISCSRECHTEAQKCLSNLILNYAHLRGQIIEPYVDCVEKRLSAILDDKFKTNEGSNTKKQLCEVLHYDLRIIFLLSALCPASRTKIRDRLVNLILNTTAREAEEISNDNYLLLIESLKSLFNLTLDTCVDASLAGEVITKLFSVVGTEKEITHDNQTNKKFDLTDQLLVNLIHLLTNMPKEVYLRLSDNDVDKILDHLDHQLQTYSRHSFRDTVLPVLNVCANICKHNECVRKRWFLQIIESATDFEKRPEEYNTLRGRLVKLMTSVDVHIKDIAAEFVHALCGGDTEKFITYTGLGNSAAFLSSRGLLGKTSSSMDAGASNTTDYNQLRNKINPITGKIEAPKKNPMEGMSEEEKEYHANELANAITKLSNLGVVKPMQLDQEGNMGILLPSTSETKGDK